MLLIGWKISSEKVLVLKKSEGLCGSRPSPAGTAEEDTVCQVCPNGTFSDAVSSVQNCTEHRGCAAAAGLQLLLRGCTWHDSVCVSCTELRGEVAVCHGKLKEPK